MPRDIARACTLAFGVALLPHLAFAQATDAGRVEERIPEHPEEETPGEVAPHVQSPAAAKPGRIQPFLLKRLVFAGNTAIDEPALANATSQFVGAQIDQDKLRGLLDAATEVYRAQGYFLSRAVLMPQQVEGGTLTVTIIEGYIADLAIDAPSEDDIGVYFEDVLAERPARLSTFERAVSLTGGLYGTELVDTALKQDPRDPARFSLALKASLKRLTGQLYADNRGTESSGRDQLYAFGAVNSVFVTGDRVSLAAYTVPSEPQELLFGEVAYSVPFASLESWLHLSASQTSVNAGGPQSPFDVESESNRLSAKLTYPLLLSRNESLWLGLGFEARHSSEERLGVERFNDDIRAARLSANYRLTDSWDGTSGLYAEVSRGIEGLGSSEEGDANLSRLGGRPEFTKLRLDAWRSQSITDRLGLYVSASGQLADGPLLSAEEFGIGGPGYGRGYDYSEIVGDNALAAIGELRYGQTLNEGSLTAYQVYAFYDFGIIWNDEPQFEFEDASLASAGLGVRLTIERDFFLTFELAKPLTREVFSTGDKDIRPFISLNWAFE